MSPTFRALQVRNYRLYSLGQTLSNTGTWMQRLAQDWLVLSLTGGSGVALGITTGLQFLPFLLFGLWGGVIADRFSRRRVLVVAQLLAGVLAAGLGVLALTDTATVGLVYGFAFALGVVGAFDTPARQAFVGDLVERDDLTNAVALNSASFQLGRIVGPAVGGLLIAAFGGTAEVFFINAGTYLVAVAALVAIRGAELRPLKHHELVTLRQGLAYLRGRADLVMVLVLVAAVGTFGLNFQLYIAMMSRQEFGRGAAAFGALSTILALGSLAGSLLAARRGATSVAFVLTAAAAFGAAEVLVALMPTYATFGLLLPLAGLTALTFVTAAQSYVQLHSARWVRGRVMGVYTLMFMGGTPVGAPIIGWLSEQFGPRSAMILGGSLVIVSASALTLLVRRRPLIDEPISIPAAEPATAR
ncbi:MAG: MFS transporter [Candidatus Nanopelagicales bacterium]